MLSLLTAALTVLAAPFWTTLVGAWYPDAPPPASASAAEAWVGGTLARMTLDDKIGQLFVTQAAGTATGTSGAEWRRVTGLVEQGHVGGVIFMRGDARRQALATQQLQALAPVPLLISQDIETGLAMRLDGTTRFPSAMAVGATRDPSLAYLMGRAIAEEARAMGVHQAYAPVADVNVNPDNPVINTRSFGEDPALVGALATATARGMQDGGLIATLKHFPGHGDTDTDTHVRLATITASRDRLEAVELAPFRQAIDAGVLSVMTGHLSVPALDGSGGPATLSPAVITQLLRGELGFDGLVVTDGMNMRAMRDQGDVGEMSVRALEAGVDQLLMTENERRAANAIRVAVESGRLSEARIDASVRRVLRAKVWAGLAAERGPIDIRGASERPLPPPAPRARPTFAPPSRELLGRSEALARQITRRAVTVVQNADGPVPFVGTGAPTRVATIVLDASRNERTGDPLAAAIAARIPAGGAALSRRLGASAPAAAVDQAIADAEASDVVVVATFIRVLASSGDLRLAPRHQAVVRRLMDTGKPVIVAAFGSPYVTLGLPRPAAFVTAYGDDDIAQEAVADALFGRIALGGRLPIRIPGRYDAGEGVRLPQQALRPATPAEAGLDADVVEQIDDVVQRALASGAFPGATVAVARGGALVRLQGYGALTRGGARPTPDTPYDLASLTKVVGTTTAAMRLAEQGRLDLDAPVARYVPAFAQTGKGAVTVRQLLTHSAGLRPFYPFYARGILTRQGVLDFIHADTLTYTPGSRSVYSDFDMIALGEVIEAVAQAPLDDWLRETLYAPLGMTRTGFRPSGTVDPEAAPTERDAWRGRTLQGEVHDEAASVLGGVAGHAGLFSTAADLARFGLMLTNGGEAYGHRVFGPATLQQFTRRSPLRGSYEMGLGWMLRPADGSASSAGTRFGPRSFGHTGFTGTSIWVDPDEQLFVILLTNRVHPTRENNRIRTVRPQLADAVAGAIVAPAAHPERALGFGPVPGDLPVLR